jgi:hypothetical protein
MENGNFFVGSFALLTDDQVTHSRNMGLALCVCRRNLADFSEFWRMICVCSLNSSSRTILCWILYLLNIMMIKLHTLETLGSPFADEEAF